MECLSRLKTIHFLFIDLLDECTQSLDTRLSNIIMAYEQAAKNIIFYLILSSYKSNIKYIIMQEIIYIAN